MRYPGGKNLNGVYQRLINQIPPHRVYIETHLGSGAIMRHKRPAETNIGIDIDEGVLQTWNGSPDVQLVRADAAAFLAGYPFEGDEFIYADPPYLAATRASDRSPYRNDYTDVQHLELLDMLLRLPCRVMVSGYWSDVYARRLASWRTLSFGVRTRSGESAKEWVWMNYPEPDELHDYHFLGDTFRERERIRRRIERWQLRLERLPPLERRALIAALR
jgi:site-specific DNA-adenine methylase